METLLARLNIESPDNRTNIILNDCIKQAQQAFERYYHTNDLSQLGFDLESQTTALAAYNYQKIKNNGIGIIQMSQGSRSQTMECNGIPSDILATLPKPKVRMMG